MFHNVVFFPGFGTAQGKRNDFRTGFFNGCVDEGDRIFAGAENEAGCKFTAA